MSGYRCRGEASVATRLVVMLVAAEPKDDEQQDHDEADDPDHLHPARYAAVGRLARKVYVVTTAIEHERRHRWNHQPIASDLQVRAILVPIP
jgi:hypothetical protein